MIPSPANPGQSIPVLQEGRIWRGKTHSMSVPHLLCSLLCRATLNPIPSITERNRQIFTHPAEENDFTQELKVLPCLGCLFSNKSPLFSLFPSSEQNQLP